MSKRLGSRGLFAVSISIMLLAASARQAEAITLPILTRPILKSFFQSGDKPTQSQFAAFIDSSINFVDDRKLLGLKVYNPSATYVAGDCAIFQRLAPGAMVGQLEQGGTTLPPQIEFGGLTGLSPNNPLSVDVATDFAGAYGFMGIKLEAPNGDINYGFIQMGMDPPSNLLSEEEPPAIHVHYIVYNDEANAPLEVVPVPEPTSALAIGAIAMLMLGESFDKAKLED